MFWTVKNKTKQKILNLFINDFHACISIEENLFLVAIDLFLIADNEKVSLWSIGAGSYSFDLSEIMHKFRLIIVIIMLH